MGDIEEERGVEEWEAVRIVGRREAEQEVEV